MALQQELTSDSSVLSRKVHKADREKLRRDKLNEQFAELAAVLDPDKPKLDKASILGDSLQAVRDLRNEIKRLRTERGTLFDESRDLKREKCDLEEERAVLQKQTDELESQLQQVLKAAMTLNSKSFEEEPAPAPAPSPAPEIQQHHPYLVPGLMMSSITSSSSSNPFVYLTTPSIHRVERPCAQYATSDSVPDFLSKVQHQLESNPGFQPLPPTRHPRVLQLGDHFPGGYSAADESDTELHLGQPRPSGDDKAPEVDTSLHLNASATRNSTSRSTAAAAAHAGAE